MKEEDLHGPDGTPLDLSDNPVLANFDYERYATV